MTGDSDGSDDVASDSAANVVDLPSIIFGVEEITVGIPAKIVELLFVISVEYYC